MPLTVDARPAILPVLDPEFLPASTWNRSYRELVRRKGGEPLRIALERRDGSVSVHRTSVLEHRGEAIPLNQLYVERLIKFLLWQKGGYRVVICRCARDLAVHFFGLFSRPGVRAFDYAFMGEQVYGTTMSSSMRAESDPGSERDSGRSWPPLQRLPDRFRSRRQRPQICGGHRRRGDRDRGTALGPVLQDRSPVAFRTDQDELLKIAAANTAPR